ncbi:hypothetical protein AB0D04_28975 [Streptomyces sp. NPDC048483]|uniref:hypothetical protein n=1 Tax=Streptomyces sp. NPDC048483 TaxID=3154927 RepID=UPI003418BF81
MTTTGDEMNSEMMTEIFSAMERDHSGWSAESDDSDCETWVRLLTEHIDSLAAGLGFDEGHAGGCG